MNAIKQSFYRVLEVADLLRVSRRSVERLIADGILHKIKVRGCTLIPAEDVNRLVQQNKERAG